MIYNMASFQNEARKMIDEKKPITLMHLWVMVFENLDHSRYASKDRPQPFLKEVLCTAIKGQISDAEFLSTEYDNRKVYPIMRKGDNDSYAKSEIYDRIYNILIQNTDRAPFLYLNEQYDTLRHLAVNPNTYADKLWNAMLTTWARYDHKSYIDILCARARWLFKDHEEDWKEFDVERIYKLLTVAIAISLNQKTWTTKDDENPEEPKDPLDILCKKFLYDGPPEVLPIFTLQEIFDTLFPDEMEFAVKQARDADYSMVQYKDLTDRDRLCILLPWLGAEYDLHPDSEEAAKSLLDNNIAEAETADRVRAFFKAFSNSTDHIWNSFVAHLKESFTQCVRVKHEKVFTSDANIISNALRNPLNKADFPKYSSLYRERLLTHTTWRNIAYNKFWAEDQVDIALPEQCVSEADVQQLYQYITAYVLIALCCLKMEGSETREVRKAFKDALIHKIHAPMSVPIEVHEEAIRKIKALEYVVQDVTKEKEDVTNENEDRKRYIETSQMTMRALVRQWMIELHTSFDADLREARKRDIKDVLPWCGYTQNEIAEIEEELITNSRVRKNDPPGWNNGGN